MATSAEIVLVGLCSFVNMKGTPAPNLPPPSVNLPRYSPHPHIPFIAFDGTKIVLSGGETAVPIGSNFNMLILDGEQLLLNDDQSSGPTVPTTFYTDLPSISTYSKIKPPQWNPDRVTPPGQHPTYGSVAAYLEFGAGTIAAKSPTHIEWEFRDENGIDTTPSLKGKFATEVALHVFGSQRQNRDHRDLAEERRHTKDDFHRYRRRAAQDRHRKFNKAAGSNTWNADEPSHAG